MEKIIKSHEQEYKFVQIKGQEYAPVSDQFEANKNMANLESLLASNGFECTQKREIKWDPAKYVKIVDESGRYIELEIYFSGPKETIRRKQSVNYDIKGLERDVKFAIDQINEKPLGKCYTCR